MKIDPSDTVRLRAATYRNMTLKFTVPLREGRFEKGCWIYVFFFKFPYIYSVMDYLIPKADKCIF